MQALKNSLQQALPWLLLFSGLFALTFGSFVKFDNEVWAKYLTSLGGSILASGIFALILKSVQFLGVFKEELNSIIFDTKFLRNRQDLHLFWEKVTKEMVKDKFPVIHNEIMKDVKDTYLPTALVHYYDNCTDVIEIELIDRDKQIIRVKQHSSFTIVPGEPNTDFIHPYVNQITCKPNCTDTTLVLNSVKVNSKEVQVKFRQKMTGNILESRFDIPLGSKSGYKVEINVTKTYSLLEDDMISYINSYIQNNFKVQMLLKGVKVNFRECGTLNNFKTIHDREELLEKQYTGLMYKRQGYIAYLKIR